MVYISRYPRRYRTRKRGIGFISRDTQGDIELGRGGKGLFLEIPIRLDIDRTKGIGGWGKRRENELICSCKDWILYCT